MPVVSEIGLSLSRTKSRLPKRLKQLANIAERVWHKLSPRRLLNWYGTMPKNSHTRVCVNLWHMAGVGIIVPYPCGVFYSNQVGGYACHHPAVEGVLIPLTTGEGVQTGSTCPLSTELHEYFTGPRWNGWCMKGIDDEAADYLDNLFQKYRPTSNLRVDRTLLEHSEEAWIHVTFRTSESCSLFSGLPFKTAVLTWPNSD